MSLLSKFTVLRQWGHCDWQWSNANDAGRSHDNRPYAPEKQACSHL